MERAGERPAGAALAAFAAGWLLAAYAERRGARHAPAPGRIRAAIYFGVVWIALGILPGIVSTYASPRHAYLASAGWAIATAIALHTLWRRNATRAPRILAAAGAGILVASYAFQLRQVLRDWEVRAAMSAKAVADVEREALSAARHAAHRRGIAAKLGFRAAVRADAAVRRRGPYPSRGGDLGFVAALLPRQSLGAYTRERLQGWAARLDRPPVVGMYWHPVTGELRRLSDREDPSLRALVLLLLDTGDGAALDANIARLLREYVPLHSRASSR